MYHDDSPVSDRTVLQVFGKYIAFMAATIFVAMLVYLGNAWWSIPESDRSRSEILSYYAALLAGSFCMLLSGLALRFQRSVIGFGFLLLAFVVVAWGMPDR